MGFGLRKYWVFELPLLGLKTKGIRDEVLTQKSERTVEKKSRRQFLKSLAYVPGVAVAAGALSSGVSTPALGNTAAFVPSYLRLHRNGELKARGEILWEKMRSCTLCPRMCKKNRLRGQRGDCRANATLEISSAFPHFGEEPELVGNRGSGAIFFTNCPLHCVFCINYEVSQLGHGREYTVTELANMMLLLQRQGCHNINLVTPTHYIPHILLALDNAAGRGLRLPMVYNTCSWKNLEVLQMLDGIVDIYLPDFKYADAEAANTFSPGAFCYPETAKAAILEMHRQVGTARPHPTTNLVTRGVMIRHLVMPNNVARTDLIMQWIAANLPRDTYVNIMSQYTPMFRAGEFPQIARRITRLEYQNAVNAARRAGLTNIKLQMR